jgi:hypothetical protein
LKMEKNQNMFLVTKSAHDLNNLSNGFQPLFK